MCKGKQIYGKKGIIFKMANTVLLNNLQIEKTHKDVKEEPNVNQCKLNLKRVLSIAFFNFI